MFLCLCHHHNNLQHSTQHAQVSQQHCKTSQQQCGPWHVHKFQVHCVPTSNFTPRACLKMHACLHLAVHPCIWAHTRPKRAHITTKCVSNRMCIPDIVPHKGLQSFDGTWHLAKAVLAGTLHPLVALCLQLAEEALGLSNIWLQDVSQPPDHAPLQSSMAACQSQHSQMKSRHTARQLVTHNTAVATQARSMAACQSRHSQLESKHTPC